MVESPNLALFNVKGIESMLQSLTAGSKSTIESKGFMKLEVKKPLFGWGGREILDRWGCPLILSVEDTDSLLAQFLGYDSWPNDSYLGRIHVERGRFVESEEDDGDNYFERLDLKFVRSVPTAEDANIPPMASVKMEVQSFEGARHYSIRRRDAISGYGLIWMPEDLSDVFPNESFLYSEVLKSSNLAARAAA